MKIAFLISAHTDAAHLQRLIHSLPEGSAFYIHIDRKSNITPFRRILTSPQVHFISHRVNVVWGSINEVEYQMELIRAALSDGNADYLITISGMDYPVWSNQRIIDYLSADLRLNYLQGIAMLHQGKNAETYTRFRFFADKPWRNGSWRSKLRVSLRHAIAALGIRKTLTIHTKNKEYMLYKGAAWWAIRPDLARLVLQEWDHNERLVQYFRTSFCPAETFVQTVAFNSKFAPFCQLSIGQYKSLAALTPLTYIDYGKQVKILTEEDYQAIKASKKMFCRKTVSGTSDRLLERIDAERQ